MGKKKEQSAATSITEILAGVIASCPVWEGGPEVQIDMIAEKAGQVALFPTGQKKLGCDILGNERWEYGFIIQIAAPAGHDRQRGENEARIEEIVRWFCQINRDGIALGVLGEFESVGVQGGSTVNTSQNGMNYVYEIKGTLRYMRREKNGAAPRQRWLICLDGRQWHEVGYKIFHREEKPAQDGRYYTLSGGEVPCAALADVTFYGMRVWGEPLQEELLKQTGEKEAVFIKYYGGRDADGVAAVIGKGRMYAREEKDRESDEAKVYFTLAQTEKGTGKVYRQAAQDRVFFYRG